MSDRMLRLALRLHPAAYRREWGDEIAAVFADTTAEAGRWATARELLDLAGHGLRGRVGLGSAGRPARLAALAAPAAAGAAAGAAVVEFYSSLLRGLLYGYRISWPFQPWPVYGTHQLLPWPEFVGEAAALLTLVVALAALAGRWSLARPLAPLAALGMLAANVGTQLPLGHYHSVLRLVLMPLVLTGPQLFWALIMLAAPRDLLGPARRRRSLALLAGLVVNGPMFDQLTMGLPSPNLLFLVDPLVLLSGTAAIEALLIAAGALALRWDRPGLAAAALAGLPFLLLDLVAQVARPTPEGLTTVVIALGVIAAAVVIGRRGRSARPA